MASFIAKQVAKGLAKAAAPLKGTMLPATLIKVTQGARTSGNLSAGRAITTTNYTCKGFVTSSKQMSIGGTLVSEGARVVVLIGATIAGGAVPEEDDRITIGGDTDEILAVDQDSAAATYTLLTKKR